MNRSFDVVILILNPSNLGVCDSYASYRRGLRTASSKNGSLTDGNKVRLELLSTIVSAFILKTEQPLLKIKIGLKDHFSLFRIDLSSTRAILTREDPKEPAILYEKGTFFYDAYLEDLRQAFEQSKQIDMTKQFVVEGKVTDENLKDLLKELGLYANIQDDDISEIKRVIHYKINPYS